MARALDRDSAEQVQIAKLVSRMLPIGLQSHAGTLQLGEMFDIRVVTPKPSADVLDSFPLVGNYHHQIYRDAEAVGFARSRRADHGTGFEILLVAQSLVAGAISDAINEIDRAVPEDVETALLLAPAFDLTAFVFIEDAYRVYVISCPAGLSDLQAGDLIPGREFLTRLQQERPRLGGLPG